MVKYVKRGCFLKEENKSVNDVIDYFNQIEGNAANVVAMKLI